MGLVCSLGGGGGGGVKQIDSRLGRQAIAPKLDINYS